MRAWQTVGLQNESDLWHLTGEIDRIDARMHRARMHILYTWGQNPAIYTKAGRSYASKDKKMLLSTPTLLTAGQWPHDDPPYKDSPGSLLDSERN